MSGVVEVDEAFIGKGSKVYNWSGISTRRQPIIGMLERQTGRVRIFLVETRNAKALHKLVFDNIEIGSTIYTDSWRGYNNLDGYYRREIVDHSKKEFVRGDVHTNNIESFWGKLKRNLRRAHIQISAKYAGLYVTEAVWRHNSKGKTQIQLFDDLLRRVLLVEGSSSAQTQKGIELL